MHHRISGRSPFTSAHDVFGPLLALALRCRSTAPPPLALASRLALADSKGFPPASGTVQPDRYANHPQPHGWRRTDIFGPRHPGEAQQPNDAKVPRGFFEVRSRGFADV